MPQSTFFFFVLMNSFLGTIGYPRGGGGEEYVLYIVLYWVQPLTLWIRHLDLDRKGAYFAHLLLKRVYTLKCYIPLNEGNEQYYRRTPSITDYSQRVCLFEIF